MLGRRHVFRLGFGLAAVGAAGGPARAEKAGGPRPVLVTQTFVKALPDRSSQLGRFLDLNWLVMDRAGIEAGIFTHATLFAIASASGAGAAETADFIVEVGYLTPGGYRDVETAFNDIRRKHQVVRVDGLGMAELGRVVGERQLRPLALA